MRRSLLRATLIRPLSTTSNSNEVIPQPKAASSIQPLTPEEIKAIEIRKTECLQELQVQLNKFGLDEKHMPLVLAEVKRRNALNKIGFTKTVKSVISVGEDLMPFLD